MGGPKMRLKYVHAFIDRHGHTRYYFRCNGRRIKLPGAFASHDFLNAYAAAWPNRAKTISRRASPPAMAPSRHSPLAIMPRLSFSRCHRRVAPDIGAQ